MNLQERSQVFMDKAKKLHDNEYDYSKVVYTNSRTKVIIGCNNCGKLFDQTPMSHISTSHPCGCPHCRYQRCHKPKPYTTLDTAKFIEKATGIHGSMYTYELVNYTNSWTKVDITCPIHGVFSQAPNNHLSNKQGCPRCELVSKQNRNKLRRKPVDEFINEAVIRHGNQYDYTNIEYVSSSEPVTITCYIHGNFTVARAEKHLTGQACPT
jgi:DNA-directed RNA polymerase subunit RPC12/RpoP